MLTFAMTRRSRFSWMTVTVALLASACGGQEESDGPDGSSTGGGGAAGIGGSLESGGSAGVGGSGAGNAPGSGGAIGGGGVPGAGGQGGSPAGGAASGGGLGGGAGGDLSGSGGDTAAGGDAGAGPCPGELPIAEADCPELNLSCSYGADPRWECRARALCLPFSLSSGRLIWNVTLPPDSCDAPPLPDECPASPATGDCTAPPDQCVYDDGTVCLCTVCDPNAPVCGPVGNPSWVCRLPPVDCPAFPPNEGTACSEPEGTACNYRCDQSVICADGLWELGPALCPDCAAPDTGIETPSGLRPISEIQAGDLVFSLVRGVRTAVPVLKTGRAPKAGHFVAKITLTSGATLFISGGHPTADGRTLDDLSLGDTLGSAQVAALELVPYPHPFTYDILPDSPDGSYFAEGALIGSTLFVPRELAKKRLSER